MGRNAKLRSDRQLQRSRWGTDVLSPEQKKLTEMIDKYAEIHDQENQKIDMDSRQIYGEPRVDEALTRFPYPIVDSREGWVKAAVKFIDIESKISHSRSVSQQEQALMYLLGGCLTNSGANDVTDEGLEMIKRSGSMLGDLGGFAEMQRIGMTWVPKCCSRTVDVFWDGIHGWQS